MTDGNENAGNADGSGPGDKAKRPTLDEKLAALYAEQARLKDQLRAKRTRGLIVVGAATDVRAVHDMPTREWLHRIWLGTAERDREAVRIAISSFDVTKPPLPDTKPGQPAKPAGPVPAQNGSPDGTAAPGQAPSGPPSPADKPAADAMPASPTVGPAANAGGAMAAGIAPKPAVAPPTVLRPANGGRQA